LVLCRTIQSPMIARERPPFTLPASSEGSGVC
jgi:hypothetical protein